MSIEINYYNLLCIFKELIEADKATKKIYMEIHGRLPEKIYKYYALTSDEELNKKKLDCLHNNEVYLSNREDFNDPYDDKGYILNKAELKKYASELGMQWNLSDIYPDFKRIACFTTNNPNNMAMWANYANNHKGYCVEYNLRKRGNLGLYAMCLPVQYIKEKIDLTEITKKRMEMTARKRDLSLVTDALKWCSIILTCVKHESWSYESEIRYCVPLNTLLSPYCNAFPSKIYIGSNCEQGNKDELIKISKEIKVPIYEMKLDQESIKFELSPERIY